MSKRVKYQLVAHTPRGVFSTVVVEYPKDEVEQFINDYLESKNLDNLTLELPDNRRVILTGNALSDTVFEVYMEEVG